VNGDDKNTKEVLRRFGIVPDQDDIKIVQYVCEVASNRAALLVSICTLNKITSDKIKDTSSVRVLICL